MSTKVAVVIPVYKEKLDELEKISLAQARKILGKYPFVFVAPEGKIFSYFESGEAVAHFPQQFFKNVASYSRLLMSPYFYEAFKAFDYILIYQLDAFVFYDALEKFCSLGYDYIGAPWLRMFIESRTKMVSRVGNGGFSLRNVQAHIKLLNEHSALAKSLMGMPEDNFFSHCGKRTDCAFHVAPINVAYKFSAEFHPERVVKKNGGHLPFGCHAWHYQNPNFYAKIFSQLGYRFPSIVNTGVRRDFINWLTSKATQRLIRRVNHNQPLMRYLPKNHFASVRVVRSQLAMKIFAQLFLENPALADEVHLYDESDQDILLNDLNLKRELHLIIGFGNVDNAVVSAAERKGISYGKRIVSFQREYISHCEKLFHDLGK